VNLTKVKEAILEYEEQQLSDEQGLYLGTFLWSGTEYPKQMSGPHGESTKYMSGWLNAVSYNVASYIVNEDWTHSVLMAYYGTSSEDLNIEQWINCAV
jgi:hypothetical protein